MVTYRMKMYRDLQDDQNTVPVAKCSVLDPGCMQLSISHYTLCC